MQEIEPLLISCKPLKPEYERFKIITINTDVFTVGRGLNNSAVIPYLSISRNHCALRKSAEDEWTIEDYSSFGIEINGKRLGKGQTGKLTHDDVITMEPSQEFVYKFIDPCSDEYEVPKKRMKMENSVSNDIINNVKMKFEESQTCEMKHIEDKIQNAKQMQTTSMILKQRLQLEMDRKMQQLQSEFASQIENLKGEKDEVERQKALLIEERNTQLASVKEIMEGKITELKNQIHKHNETESELVKENSLLKEKLLKEREEFLSELSRENSSKQEMLERLEGKIREHEEIRLKEKQDLEELLRKETEQLRLAKEKELKELEEQKKLREQELIQELDNIKKNLEEQVEQTEQQRLRAQQQLNEQMEQMKKLSDEEKVKMEQLVQEREEIQNKLTEAQINAEKSLEELRSSVNERETELAALAAERIQKQADQSSEVISLLQEQLEKVRSELQSVETEKNTLLESLCLSDPLGEGTSKQNMLAEVGELMESELQCSICAELFVAATTLNCSHTFCKYCITMWKKKKKDCPICRSSITSECKSLVLDSFIEKMVQNLTEEMKKKREELLKFREELDNELAHQLRVDANRRSRSYDYEDSDDLDSDDVEFEGVEEEYEVGEDYDHRRQYWQPNYYADDTDSGSDDDSNDSDNTSSASSAAGAGVPRATGGASAAGGDAGATGGANAAPVPGDASNRTNADAGGRRRGRGRVAGIEGAYYGGYGRCFNCGARGHWAPGCPFR